MFETSLEKNKIIIIFLTSLYVQQKLLVTLAASITRIKPMQSPYSGKAHSQGLYLPSKALQKSSY
jgi:hypothetical protein